MILQEALKLRDEVRPILIGQQFDKLKDWKIVDVIVTGDIHPGIVYDKMYQTEISNELALSLFSQTVTDNYDVFIISHQWPWGSGDMFHERLASYKKANPF